MNVREAIQPRVRDLPPSGIRKFFELVSEMRDAISLSVGEPDFITPWRIREAGIYSLEQGRTHYSPNAGLLRLRQAASGYLERRMGLSYDPRTQILVTVGGSEAIDLGLRSLAGPGDEVVIPEPCFVSYKPCAILAGAVPVTVPLSERDGFRLTPEKLEKALTPRSKVLIFPFPNNPTGAVMGREDMEKLLPLIARSGMMVISDEIYAELSYAGRHVSIASLPGMAGRTLVINGFSKSYAMTGWRLGYAAGHPDLIAAMYKIHQYAIMCSPTLSQHAGVEALENCDAEVEEMAREYNRRRRVMLAGFREAGLDCFEPTGAFYVFPSLASTGMGSLEFCERLLREEKVAVVPGSAFGEAGEGYFRACYAYSLDNINEALGRIKAFVGRHRKA
ncbi:MAG: aminotransferase class I/II-fold pyridoxal phosphate-dependent enzyme [Planctomycetota bacterium]|jgi:aminotransferase|nr:aminotransferase class I/II-fold pyridoxal phosphate-dependent enzyme [Planctomycetota bacterium]